MSCLPCAGSVLKFGGEQRDNFCSFSRGIDKANSRIYTMPDNNKCCGKNRAGKGDRECKDDTLK